MPTLTTDLRTGGSTVSNSTLNVSLPETRELPRTLRPGTNLRLEGAILFVVATALFAQTGASWWLFGLLFFVPDIGLLGYVAGKRTGALTYNLTHGLSVPLGLALAEHLSDNTLLAAVALVWVAHIGFDRVLGYGLKYPTDFHDTHLQRVA